MAQDVIDTHMESNTKNTSTKKKVLLHSRLAFYPMHWDTFKIICKEYNIEPYVITTSYADLPEAHKMLGTANLEKDKADGFSPQIFYIPQGNFLLKVLLVFKYLHAIKPDVVWAQEEPVTPFEFPVLLYYFFRKNPRIVTGLNENIFTLNGPKKWLYNTLWKRINGILSTTALAVGEVRKAGMPKNIPAWSIACGCLSPIEDNTAVMNIPIRTNGDFIIGFAGRITEVKGWKLIIEAMRTLPSHFKLAVAGSGDQLEELKKLQLDPAFSDRIWIAGLLPKEKLWHFYRGLDCLAVPSLTTRLWKEQSGGVLQDAMAVSLPIVGSDSGGIPEITGDAGLIVPENDSKALADAFRKLEAYPGLRKELGENGKKRFDQIFSLHAYAKIVAKGLGLEDTEAGPKSTTGSRIEKDNLKKQ